MNLDIWLYTSQLLDHTLVHKFTSINKKIREYFLSHLVQIIDYLLEKNGHKALPRWCYMKISADEESSERAVRFKEEKIGQLPSVFNIKGGVIAIGDSILSEKPKKFNVYLEDECYPPCKKIKATLDKKTLVLTFKHYNIEELDVSVCQFGIDLKTNKVFVTPLYTYSKEKKVVICRIPEKSRHLKEGFVLHVLLNHNQMFDLCDVCRPKSERKNFFTNYHELFKNYLSEFRERLHDYNFIFIE